MNQTTTQPLTPRDYWEAARRRRTWLLAPVLIAVTIGTVGALVWPDTYVSEAVLRVSPPAASPAVVPSPLTNIPLADRLAVIQQSILSRANLTGVIQTLDLYRSERARMPMEDVIERMRRAVTVSGLAASGAGPNRSHVFRVSFAYHNRYDAHKVTQTLVSRFLDESTREKSGLNDLVNHFLREEFAKAETELNSLTGQLAQFRREGGGAGLDAPGLLLQQLTLFETRASGVNANLGRARQEEAVLEAELEAARAGEARGEPARRPVAAAAAAPARHPALLQLEAELQVLESRYKPGHPEVQRMVKRLEVLRSALAAPAPTAAAALESPAAAVPPLPVATPPSDRVVRLAGQLRAKRIEIARAVAELEEVARESARLRSSLAGAPERVAEFERLTRERELAAQRHEQAKRKLLDGEASSKGNLWRLGESIELVDAPALPETPVAPQRAAMIAVSAAFGLLLGVTLVMARELSDETLKTIRQVRGVTELQVMAGIPLIENELVLRRRRRTAWLGWALALAVSVGSIAGAAVYRFREY